MTDANPSPGAGKNDVVTGPADAGPGRGGSLTVLGCDGSYPGPGGAASGYLVRGGGVTVWLDAGSGTFAQLQKLADPHQVDAVVLSHEHPDHWSDVDSYAVWLREVAPGRRVPVYAAPGVRTRSYFADDRVLSWHEVEALAQVDVRPGAGHRPPGPGLRLSFFATDHGPPTLAARLDVAPEPGASWSVDRALGYTADTGPGWSPGDLGPGIALLLCEATYTREHEGESRHLSGRQAGRLAAAAGVGTLVLTHRRPSVDPDALAREAAETFEAPVVQAAAGMVLRW